MNYSLDFYHDTEMVPFLEHTKYASNVNKITTKNGMVHDVKFVSLYDTVFYGVVAIFDCLGPDKKVTGAVAVCPKYNKMGPVVSAVGANGQRWNRYELAKARMVNVVDNFLNEQEYKNGR